MRGECAKGSSRAEHTVELAACTNPAIARPPGISGEPPTFNDTNVAKNAILQATGNWTTARPVSRALAICGLGVAFGAATSLSNWFASQFDPDSIARIPSLILDAGWTWAALGVLAGWLAAAPRSGTAAGVLRSAAAGVLVLVAATAAYFGVDSVARDEPFTSYMPEILRWWVASALAGPILGLVGAIARRPTVPGLLARLAIPVGATVHLLGLPSAATPVASSAVTAARAHRAGGRGGRISRGRRALRTKQAADGVTPDC